MAGDLDGKGVIVTGAASGIGRAIADRLVAAGAQVLASTASRIRRGRACRTRPT